MESMDRTNAIPIGLLEDDINKVLLWKETYLDWQVILHRIRIVSLLVPWTAQGQSK